MNGITLPWRRQIAESDETEVHEPPKPRTAKPRLLVEFLTSLDLTMFAGKSEDFVSVLFFEVKLEKYYNNITVITIKVCLT